MTTASAPELHRIDGAMLNHGVHRQAGNQLPSHKLRVMLVDDNRINLSVLNTLLKRRFSNLIDGQPVAVDSGLKAIQLLRTNVFDVILMDIQMPFLSGLDASIRIRNGEDYVLEANRDAHIVAVTTAVGDEPELAYRRAGMDGMIGKPVRFQDMQQYLSPLAHEAHNAAGSVAPISLDGQQVMPPLPPATSRSLRIFYLPQDTTVRSPRPEICKGADFEKMLRAQTRASLRKCGDIAIARSGTWSGSIAKDCDRFADSHIKSIHSHQRNDMEKVSEGSSSSRSSSSGSMEPLEQSEPRPRMMGDKKANTRHSRGPSIKIDQHLFGQQIVREIEIMDDQGDVSDHGAQHQSTIAERAVRPNAIHRTSSPAWLSDRTSRDEATQNTSLTSSTLMASPIDLPASPPDWLTGTHRDPIDAARTVSSTRTDNGVRSTCSNSDSNLLYLVKSVVRRDSQPSSESEASGTSTDVTTPVNENAGWPSTSLLPTSDRSYFKHERANSSSTIDPWSSDDAEDLDGPCAASHGSFNTATSYGVGKKGCPNTQRPGNDSTIRLSSPLRSRQRGLHAVEVAKLAHDVRQLDLTD